MTIGFFEVDTWGEAVGTGASAARYCTMTGIAKVATLNQPYVVANELICSRLGLMLGLPVPPGVIVESEGALAYVSLRFGHRGERPPPVIAAHLIEDDPRLGSGIIIFDLWIANQDRHEGNLAYARGSQPLHVFDHGHALLGAASAGEGIATLKHMEDQPTPSSCLTPAMRTARHFGEWLERVSAVRDDVIDDLVAAVTQGTGQAALAPDEGRATANFLKRRRVRIAEFLRTIRPLMPNVTDWGPP